MRSFISVSEPAKMQEYRDGINGKYTRADNDKPFTELKSEGVYVTKKGTPLYWNVYYLKGGINYLTDDVMPRAYYLDVKRDPTESQINTPLNTPQGTTMFVLNEVSRKSEKQFKIALIEAKSRLAEVESEYNI